MTEIQKKILALAVFTYGEENQIMMAIEEAGELITALAKKGRVSNGSSISDVIDEMADMQIMLDQLKLIFDDGESFDKAVQKKLFRLDARLQKSVPS